MKFKYVTRMLSRIVCSENGCTFLKLKCTGPHKRILIHCGQKSVLTRYNSQIKSHCRNVSEACIGLENFLVLFFLSVCLIVCLRRDSGRRHRIRLKCGTNIYALFDISCIVFGVSTFLKQRICKDAQKYFNTVQPMEGNSLKSISTWLMCMKFDEIYISYSDVLYNCLGNRQHCRNCASPGADRITMIHYSQKSVLAWV